jgi:uncharacterized protein YhjY with autotransporter beta-barrel domain
MCNKEDSSVSAVLIRNAQVAQSQKDQVWVNNEIPCQSKIQPTNMLSILKVLSAKGQQSSSLLNFNSYPNENWKTKEVSINLQYNHKIALLNTYTQQSCRFLTSDNEITSSQV